MPRPTHPPLGLHLTRVARTVSRAFDETLAEAGGSLPVWLALISLKSRALPSPPDPAPAVRIQGGPRPVRSGHRADAAGFPGGDPAALDHAPGQGGAQAAGQVVAALAPAQAGPQQRPGPPL